MFSKSLDIRNERDQFGVRNGDDRRPNAFVHDSQVDLSEKGEVVYRENTEDGSLA